MWRKGTPSTRPTWRKSSATSERPIFCCSARCLPRCIFRSRTGSKLLRKFVPKKTVAVNIEAFRRGRRWIEQARDGLLPAETTEPRAPAADTPYRVRLEITPAWCKSCDICVKLCPERCLRLNAERIVELAQPDKCTGCRLCEWLCPDFAIRVHLDQASVSRRARCRAMNAVDTALTGKSAQKLISGNTACALGAIAAGCRFFAGYPITPSSEIAERLARRLPEVGGVFVQMEDEIASMAAVIGASMGGVKAMTATSGPGFSLKQENIGYAAGAEIPCVIVNVMRGGPSTGMPTRPAQADVMQARWGSHGDYPIIVLAPASVREIFDETIRAFDLAETFRSPVVLLYDQVLAQLSETVALDIAHDTVRAERTWASGPRSGYRPYAADAAGIPAMSCPGDGYRTHTTGLTHSEDGFPTQNPEAVTRNLSRLFSKLEINRSAIDASAQLHCDDADVVIVAIGITARAANRAVELCRAHGVRAGLFRPITLWPFPEQALRAAAATARAVLVPEMNAGQLVREVERVLAGTRVEGLHRFSGEPIVPAEIAARAAALAQGA